MDFADFKLLYISSISSFSIIPIFTYPIFFSSSINFHFLRQVFFVNNILNEIRSGFISMFCPSLSIFMEIESFLLKRSLSFILLTFPHELEAGVYLAKTVDHLRDGFSFNIINDISRMQSTFMSGSCVVNFVITSFPSA